ncbi:MAG TPA: Gfo/Idh/MocA family oxidoreductase [Acidobacteriaceae bacterium]|jgi:predicted dehydrogenase|nr:Gfo/Idh/MocA family oxidoreductase [Acidobacteriaceae bacterium]
MRTRFAILGFGHHAVRRLLQGFRESAECELVGLWRRNQQAAAANAREFGIATAFSSPEELCASPAVDAVFVTSPDALHHSHTLLALQHGKAVLCEKPLAMNAREAQSMQDAAQAHGVLFGVAQNFRYNRSVQAMRQWIADGKIGQPLLAHSQFLYLAEKSPRAWIYDPSLATGGPIADVGVHCIDALRFILQAEVQSITTQAHGDAESGNVESVASLQLACTQGILANVTVSTRAPYRSLLEVVGTDGVLHAENGLTVDQPVTVELWRGGACVEQETMSNADGYSRMLDSFALAMRGESVYLAPGLDGIINQQILDAAYRSGHSGRREPIS